MHIRNSNFQKHVTKLARRVQHSFVPANTSGRAKPDRIIVSKARHAEQLRGLIARQNACDAVASQP
jgi:hypothetical protein